MIIVTGGAGFIGSNLVKALNGAGHADVVVVDDLTDGRKFVNLSDCSITDYVDRDDLFERLHKGSGIGKPDAVFHQGACSDTTEWNGIYMMRNNFEYSKLLLDYCLQNKVPFLYASSASVYGMGPVFKEEPVNEKPLNLYAYSKYLFDQHVRRILPDAESQVVGLRYFNVYGPREQHKQHMASVAFHLHNQILDTGKARLFEGSDGYAAGEQRRDFVYVDDVSAVNLWLWEHAAVSGIFNLGTGRSQTFNDVASAVIDFHGLGEIEYIPFPDNLVGRYQSFTEADITALRAVGYDADFATVEDGVHRYLEQLSSEEDSHR